MRDFEDPPVSDADMDRAAVWSAAIDAALWEEREGWIKAPEDSDFQLVMP